VNTSSEIGDVQGDGEVASTASYIAYYAALRPTDIVDIENGRKITFSQFHQNVLRFTYAMSKTGLEKGDRATVQWTSL
jgi:acyl-coenzyme A synthetase/AMP-(fatty) acid ligase